MQFKKNGFDYISTRLEHSVIFDIAVNKVLF